LLGINLSLYITARPVKFRQHQVFKVARKEVSKSMSNFDQVIESLVVASVAIGLLTTYLTLNKIWSRKSDANVAKSVSVFASILGILSTIPFLIKYGFLDAEYKGAFKALVSIITGIIFLLIGSGFWVRNREKSESLWVKFKRAIKLEKHEAGDLVKALLVPTGAKKMLKILIQLAKIDRRVDDKEFQFIETFAASWNIPFSKSDLNKKTQESQDTSYIALRHSVADYLNLRPPIEQSTHLRDVLNALAKSDQTISEQEKFILDEINSMLEAYKTQRGFQTEFQVVIAPQNSDQEDLLKALLPELVISESAGGKGYLVGNFYSMRFARMVCTKYRSLNLFTAIETINNSQQTDEEN
jgi:hypothetical protein